MSLTVAGRFTTFPAAEDAAQKLIDNGFLGEDVTLFFVNPPAGRTRSGRTYHLDRAAAGTASPPSCGDDRRGRARGDRRRGVHAVRGIDDHRRDRGGRRRVSG